MLKKILIASSLALIPGLASANAIENYTVIESTNIVSANGQEWLQWDETVGKSVDWFNHHPDAQTLRDENWAIANFDQIYNLFDDFGFIEGADLVSREHNAIVKNTGTSIGDDPTETDLQFIALFGDTFTEDTTTLCTTCNTTPSDPYRHSAALFSISALGDEYDAAIVSDDQNSFGSADGLVFTSPLNEGSYYSYPAFGLALIRSAQSHTSVPEPAPFLLLALGLAGFSAAQRRQRKNHS